VPSTEFTDPRLVAAYDAINAYEPGTQPDYVVAVAGRIGARRIVDLGCGTGIVSCTLALAGYDVIAVDPAPARVDVARTKPGAERVRWVVGGADAIGTADAELAIMTGHVAQFFVADADWSTALAHLHAALRPEGRLVFESRNPDAREWETWDSERHTTVHDPHAGPIETWTRVDGVRDDVVTYTLGYRITGTGDELVVRNALRFRSESALRASLATAGFEVETVLGDWDGTPVGPTSPELIVTAVRR
jgi:SAM-dependent methyltransferase